MLIYNQLSALVAMQFLPLVLYESAAILAILFIFKTKPRIDTVLIALVTALLLVLLSLLVGLGYYGGMAYHENFGWPFSFLIVSRNIETASLSAAPYQFNFNLQKFLANTAFWIFPPFMLLFKIPTRTNSFFRTIVLAVFAVLTALFSLSNAHKQIHLQQEAPMSQVQTTDGQFIMDDIASRKLATIQKRYPQYKDYPCCQDSVHQKSTQVISDGSDHYFAFITYSKDFEGIIERADCYRVDRLFRIYLVGQFPDLADSFNNYHDIDPFICQGLH